MEQFYIHLYVEGPEKHRLQEDVQKSKKHLIGTHNPRFRRKTMYRIANEFLRRIFRKIAHIFRHFRIKSFSTQRVCVEIIH